MKRIAWILSIILILATLLPAAALGEIQITEVRISMAQPIAGATADYSPTIPSGAGYYSANLFNDENYQNDVVWIDLTAGTYVKTKGGSTFVAGHTYQVSVFLMPRSGYAFADNAKAYINGKEVYYTKYPSGQVRLLQNHTIATPAATYTVTLRGSSASEFANYSITAGSQYTLPECTFTPPAGKQFKQWQIEQGGMIRTPGTTVTVNSNLTINAIWEDKPAAAYTVTLQGSGATDKITYTVTGGSQFALPECIFTAPTGKQFKQWQVEHGGMIRTPGTTVTVNSNLTINAVWEDKPTAGYTVTLQGSGAADKIAYTVTGGSQFTLPECTFTAPTGKQFKQWQVEQGGMIRTPGTTVTVNSNLTINAVWEDLPTSTCTVTFQANGGVGASSVTVQKGFKLTLPECIFTAPANSKFTHWQLADTTIHYLPGSTVTVDSNLTFNAVWESTATTFTVTAQWKQSATPFHPSFTGFANYDGGLYYIVNGAIATTANGLVQDPAHPATWYYCSLGRAQTQYTGLVQYDGAWFYVSAGKLDTTKAGLVSYDGGLFMVGAGRILTEVNGLIMDPNGSGWYYVAAGQVQSHYTGLAYYDGAWFYVVKGKLDSTYTGYVEYDGSIFAVVGGQVV